MSEQRRSGPSLKIVARCDGCVYEHSEHYSIEDGNDVDSGHVVYCRHPAAAADEVDRSVNGDRCIGDTTWTTPKWCPLLAAAVFDLATGLVRVSK